MRLFTSFLVFGLGKVSLGEGFVRVLRLSAFSIIFESLIKRKNKKTTYSSFILINKIPSFLCELIKLYALRLHVSANHSHYEVNCRHFL
jgi:hypothetical protein